ncbi:chemotaxis protein CheW [Devosia sediminis]|uniref:Purine-binding chemotaxis protein CheW n=1 Tax=Devosia sediminis TaxID=2798801 RepID=A0A934MKW0_9HYPH|nr:chemotaxis protein CheW [Devosia sediminis]MBJ3784006.1 purine-binding chemotaxis protein CheW [Devosia sediminis]
MSALAMELDEFESPPGLGLEPRQFITFSCAGQDFGIDIMAMREIRNWSPVTPLPAQKPDVLGVIDIRGRVVPIHDLALRIGCSAEPRAQHESQVILVLKVAGHDMGLLVDSVSDIIEVKPEDMLAVPQIAGSAARFLAGIARQGDNLVAILDQETVHSHAVEIAAALAGENVDFVFLDEVEIEP